MSVTYKIKTDTKANWENSNRILKLNEPAFERVDETHINFKLGDGVKTWADLPYVYTNKKVEDIENLIDELQTSLEAIEDKADTNTNNLAAEVTARTNADTELQTAISQLNETIVPKYTAFTGETITIADNNIYYNTTAISNLAINLPTETPVGFNSLICFVTGEIAPSFDYPTTLLFLGDDCDEEHIFIPIANKSYEILISNDGLKLTARVGEVV